MPLCGEGFSTASLSYRYDLDAGKQIADANFGKHERKDLAGYWVRVEVKDDNGKTLAGGDWTGRIVDVTDDRASARRGVQRFTAHGMEWELSRNTVNRAYVLIDGEEVKIERPVGFNRGYGRAELSADSDRPNRAKRTGKQGSFLIAGDLDDAERWHAGHIISHLLAYHAPQSPLGERRIKYQPDLFSGQLLDWYEPALDTARRSVFTLIAQLASPQRLHDWYLETKAGVPTVFLVSLSDREIRIDRQRAIKANADQVELITDSPYVQPHTLTTTIRGTFDAVAARGAAIGVCFTARKTATKDQLPRGWDADAEILYTTGARDPNEVIDRKTEAEVLDRFRQRAEVQHVFSHFSVDSTAGKTTDKKIWAVNPLFLDRVDAAGRPGNFWHAGLRAENYLPLQAGIDYSGDLDDARDAEQTAGFDLRRGPLVAFQRTVDADSDDTEWLVADRAATGEVDDQRNWSAVVRPQPDAFGVTVTISGAAQHVLHNGTFGLESDATYASETRSDGNMTGQRLATVFVQLDDRVTARVPEKIAANNERIDAEAVLDIDVPKYRLDYVAAETVVDVTDAGQLEKSDGGYIRDDRPALQAVAQSAAAWYTRPRQSLSLTVTGITDRIRRGQLLTKLDGQPLTPSIVTGVHWDFVAQETHVRTAFADLDPRALV